MSCDITTKTKHCINCGHDAEHEHHVVPCVIGGSVTVPLCEVCHGKVHDRAFVNHKILTRVGLMKKFPEEPCRVLWLIYEQCESCYDVAQMLFKEGHSLTVSRVRQLIYRMKRIPPRVLVYEVFGKIFGDDNTGSWAKEELVEFIESGGLDGFPTTGKAIEQ